MTWQSLAACHGLTDLFFPDSGVSAAACQVCRTCPVQRECLDYALSDPDLRGIWAGTTQRQRHAILGWHGRQRRYRQGAA